MWYSMVTSSWGLCLPFTARINTADFQVQVLSHWRAEGRALRFSPRDVSFRDELRPSGSWDGDIQWPPCLALFTARLHTLTSWEEQGWAEPSVPRAGPREEQGSALRWEGQRPCPLLHDCPRGPCSHSSGVLEPQLTNLKKCTAPGANGGQDS